MFQFLQRQCVGYLGVLASCGWIGLDIFFVLSGFLITSNLYEQRGAENYFRNFYMRRILRLFPLYYFLFLGTFLLTPLFHIHWKLGHLAILFYAVIFVLPFVNSLTILTPFH